jgi:tetratricopeptide (TPR) repeat protein
MPVVGLTEAVEHHRSGDLDRAARSYEAALAADPTDADALHLLGLVALQRGDAGRAVALIGQAAALRPDDATFLANLAEAHWGLGEIDRAIACCQAALQREPDHAGAHANLGAGYMICGEIDAAIGHLREAVRLAPEFAVARRNLAGALRMTGDRMGAAEQLCHLVWLDPASAEDRNMLGERLLELGQAEAALDQCREAVRLVPDAVAARVNVGNALRVLGRLDEAVASFREAIRREPGHAAAHAGLADSLEELGESEASRSSLHEALAHHPRHAGVLARLATRLRGAIPGHARASIEGLLADPDLLPQQRWPLLFGLGHVLDDRGEFDRAAALFAEANALQGADLRRQGRIDDPAAHREFVDRLIATFTAEFFERTRGGGLETERPVFIVGMPRSGTSMVEQILASHRRIFGAGELNLVRSSFESIPAVVGIGLAAVDAVPLLTRDSIGRLARAHVEVLERLGGPTPADRIVDKMPDNALYLGLIAAMFPRCQVIHCRRDPRDVALSCWMTHFAAIRWACDPDDIVSRIREYQRVMEHWRRVLPVPVLEIDYETTVVDLEDTARRLVAWCGLDWDPACLAFHETRRAVRTTSAAQVRRPVYTTSVGRWRNYERPLASLFARLDPGG